MIRLQGELVFASSFSIAVVVDFHIDLLAWSLAKGF